jgi:hypothetical protein
MLHPVNVASRIPFLCKIFSPLENGLEPKQRGSVKFLFILRKNRLYIARSKEISPPKEPLP